MEIYIKWTSFNIVYFYINDFQNFFILHVVLPFLCNENKIILYENIDHSGILI